MIILVYNKFYEKNSVQNSNDIRYLSHVIVASLKAAIGQDKYNC